MTLAACIKVGMVDLKRLISSYGPEISICIRGRHAVGKSEGTYQSAQLLRDDFYKDPANQEKYNWTYEQGLPVIERRLSQLTEGDLTGMPDLSDGRKSTVFKPCDWLIDACDRPVVLFLDERNRALEGVPVDGLPGILWSQTASWDSWDRCRERWRTLQRSTV
jgi:hypothetical protein